VWLSYFLDGATICRTPGNKAFDLAQCIFFAFMQDLPQKEIQEVQSDEKTQKSEGVGPFQANECR
jgi:hypothetical protein